MSFCNKICSGEGCSCEMKENMVDITEYSNDTIRNITSLLIGGLNARFSEEKQWYLEKALQILVPDEFKECKADWQWENGVLDE